MEIREFATRILTATDLCEKLTRIDSPATDAHPGEPWRPLLPGRPPDLQIAGRRQAPAMPRPAAVSDPDKRAVAHHIMANHELQAVEVMALVLCAFPDAPPEFRLGLIPVIGDEQRHTRLHADRAAALGRPFGCLPVNGYIWKKAQRFTCLLDYLAGMPLTFEGRNLDHTLEFADHFERAGDNRSAAIARAIHRDEIEHVRFGLDWLRRLKPAGLSDWEAYCAHLHWPLRPEKARGDVFQRDARLAAGMTEEFVDQLRLADKT